MKNGPEKRAYMRRYYATHRAERMAYDVRRRGERRDEINARRRVQHAAKRAGSIDRRTLRRAPARPAGYYDRAYRRRNPELAIARSRAWRHSHRDLFAHYESRRRARLAGADGSHTIAEWREKVALFGGCCAYCGRADLPLCRDHRIPLIRGGSDYITNIVPACRPCNSAKHKKTDHEFIAERMAA